MNTNASVNESDHYDWRAPSPRYLFRFQQFSGSIDTWHLYWDELYGVRWRGRVCLTASRFVPHTDTLYALYLAQKHGTAPVHHEAFPELPRSSGGDDPVKGVAELMLFEAPSMVPSEMIRSATTALQETIDLTVSRQVPWLMPYLPSSSPVMSPAGVTSMAPLGLPAQASQQFLAAGGGAGMDSMVQLDPRVMVSFGIDHAIKERISTIVDQQTADLGPSHALALRTDLEDDLRKRLYSDPKYLTLLKWVMEAEGSFTSPMVSDFITYYFNCIKERVDALSASGEFNPTFWSERLESALSKGEAREKEAKPYHLVTLLGFVVTGELPIETKYLPHFHDRIFPVDPALDLATIQLRHLSTLAKKALEVLVRTCFIGNIEDVRCLGEKMDSN